MLNKQKFIENTKDFLKNFITEHHEDIDNCCVHNIKWHLDNMVGANMIAYPLTFSFICDIWIKHGYNPLKQLHIIPKNYGSFIEAEEIIVPDNCNQINAHAFSWNKNLKKLVLPKNISIESYAIIGCDKLEVIELKGFINCLNNWVYNCPSLKKIIVPKGFEPNIAWLDGCPQADIIYK